jgi:hypothetical protein
MADRYWVGGTGNWDATTTNWSATSGGASGASVPTLSDDVFFDTLSNATLYTVTLLTTPVCASVTVGAPATGAVTVAGSAAWSIYGSMTLAATNVTRTFTSALTFAATTTGFTITTNGVALASAITLNGAGGGWTLGSALTTTGAFTVTQGAFATANFNLTTGAFASTGALTRSLTLGSSAISCTSWSALAQTNLTLNAGTSTITISAQTFNGGSLTYYNVTRTSVAASTIFVGDANNTFNALSITNSSNAGYLSFVGNQTIGTLTASGSARNTPVTLISSANGTQVTLTVASFVTTGFVNFRDINLQGAASPLTVSTGGDGGNNTNITLATPKTVYWSLVGGGDWTATAWSLTSGGTPLAANYPLPQDTAIIEDTGLNSSATITFSTNNAIGNIVASTRTLPVTLALTSVVPQIYGDLTLSSAVTTTATTGNLTFVGYNKTQTITSAGTTIAFAIIVNNLSTTVALADALTLPSTIATTLTLGTLNLANYTLTCGLFLSTNTNTRTIAFGTGQINLTGNNATIWNYNSATGLTITGSAIVNCTYSGSTGTRLLLLSGPLVASINVNVTAGTDIVALNNTGFNNVNFTGFTGSCITGVSVTGNLTLGVGMTITSTSAWNMFATSGTQQFTSNGVTLDAPLSFIGVGGSYQLQDNLTLGSTRALTLTAGALNLNAKTLTTGTVTSTGSSVRSIAFGGGTMTVSGATFTASGTNLTTSGSGTINMTSASSKTFAGGGFSYPTLNQGGAGALVITGANTFANVRNTVQPSTITFPASTTTTVNNFVVNGTVGNLVTINSSLSGTQATLAYTGVNTIDVNFLSIKDSNATPGVATWYAGDTSVNVSNNNGWFFVVQPQAFDTHDGGGRKKDETERKRLADKNKKNRKEIIAAFEYIVEGKPRIAEEIAEPFIIVQATKETPMVVNYDGLLNSLDRVDRIFTVMIDMDDEDVLLLL